MKIEEIMAKERWVTEEACIRGNINAFDEVFAPDCVFHSYPFAPSFKGTETFKQGIRDLLKGFECTGIDWEEIICTGNVGVHRVTFNLKHTGTFPPISVPPTGKDVALKLCTVYHLENDKVIEFFEYGDYLGFLQQLGVVPPMEQK